MAYTRVHGSRRWTPYEERMLEILYKAGLHAKEIGAFLSRTRAAIHERAVRMKIHRTKEHIFEVKSMAGRITWNGNNHNWKQPGGLAHNTQAIIAARDREREERIVAKEEFGDDHIDAQEAAKRFKCKYNAFCRVVQLGRLPAGYAIEGLRGLWWNGHVIDALILGGYNPLNAIRRGQPEQESNGDT